MRTFALLVLSGSVTGCVAAQSAIGPDGRPVYFVDGMTANAAFQRAAQQCPQGYELLGAPVNSSFVDFKITYQCKLPLSPTAPATK